MTELPKKFPEYLIMYKTLTKKIEELDSETGKDKIKRYEDERTKIRNMFPENFFDNSEESL
ncbi:hypothetical protein [Nitrosarchaeum koreense]|uniref:Uncharacterized protein n=1 Tax=Nitrosarchaeum koreense MY1 TaxID=1001994 RepID=F9CWF0_9ARCH|nr:hypothetical protein [Nitrosarchaeum koreense]EGP93602.1 hypothetical protein MY1_0840 [Nitrosarchaeum koreense MY1]